MTEVAGKWEPIDGIELPFESISYSFNAESLTATLHGARALSLRFTGIVACRYELECPGFDSLPHPLPMLGPHATFPLLLIEQSSWLARYGPIYQRRKHFALISSDDLLQLIANPDVVASWK